MLMSGLLRQPLMEFELLPEIEIPHNPKGLPQIFWNQSTTCIKSYNCNTISSGLHYQKPGYSIPDVYLQSNPSGL